MHLYACNLFKTLSWLRQFKFKAASSAKQPYTGRIVRTFAEEKIGKNPKLLEDYKAFVEDIVVKRYIRRPPSLSKGISLRSQDVVYSPPWGLSSTQAR